jgi:hypothetical protein
MKTDAQIRDYLIRANGDVKAAFRLACADHSPMDQTLDMKMSQIEAEAKRGLK